MSHFLTHPSLARFHESDHPSDSDSVRYTRRRSTSNHMTRREAQAEGLTPSTGRRHRRYLNTTMSDYDTEYDTMDSDEEAEPIVDFTWHADFFKAGTHFFDTMSNQLVQNDKQTNKHLLKLRRQKREMKHNHALHDEDDYDNNNNNNGEVPLSKERRRPRPPNRHPPPVSCPSVSTTTMSSKTSLPSPPPSTRHMAPATPTTTSPDNEWVLLNKSNNSPTHQQAQAQAQEQPPSPSPSLSPSPSPSPIEQPDAPPSPSPIEQPDAPPPHHEAGQEIAHLLFMQCCTQWRQHIKRASGALIHDVERLLIHFKNGDETDHLHSSHFHNLLTPSRHTLSLSFNTAYHRFLAHGMVQFHGLYAHTTGADDAAADDDDDDEQGQGQRIMTVSFPRRGVAMHGASLLKFIENGCKPVVKKKKHTGYRLDL